MTAIRIVSKITFGLGLALVFAMAIIPAALGEWYAYAGMYISAVIGIQAAAWLLGAGGAGLWFTRRGV